MVLAPACGALYVGLQNPTFRKVCDVVTLRAEVRNILSPKTTTTTSTHMLIFVPSARIHCFDILIYVYSLQIGNHVQQW